VGRPEVGELTEQIVVGPYFILRDLPIREDSQEGILDLPLQSTRQRVDAIAQTCFLTIRLQRYGSCSVGCNGVLPARWQRKAAIDRARLKKEAVGKRNLTFESRSQKAKLHAGNQRQSRCYHRRELRKHSPAAAGRLSARVMALFRRSSRPTGMPDAFDRAPLR